MGRVNLTKRVQTSQGSRFLPAVISNNGRVKPHYVVVDAGRPTEREEHHPEGAYYLDWHEGDQRRRLSIGTDPQEAARRQSRKEAELKARAHGLTVEDSNGNGGRPLAAAIAEYLADVQLTKKPKTYASYSTALDYFQQSCPKLYLEDIERRDLLKFAAYLRETKEQSPRSVFNKFNYVIMFLKAQGVRGLVTKNDRPRFTEEEPEIYDQEELDALFAACDAQERLWFEFFLTTGMREQEVMHVCWPDVNFTAHTVRVSHKPQFNWTPKAYKEREIPLTTKLVASLKAHKAKANKSCNLVFATAGCKPKLDFLDCLKTVAKRAKLDPANFWLHKFRATFATRCLWGGVDLRTVQAWLGHSDLESTMRYLKPARNAAVREKVNEIFA